MRFVEEENVQLKDQAYNFIKKNIVTCNLMPGANISENEIAFEMGISRTPVREAILRLSQEGLIMIYPRRGMIVSPVTVQNIHEVFEIRKMVESYVAIQSSKAMSEDYLLKTQEKFREISVSDEKHSYLEYFDFDIQFHKFIIKSSKNNLLIEFMDKVYDLDYRIKALSTLKKSDVEMRSKPEHDAIIEALLRHNEEDIEKWIHNHIENALAAALRQVY